jgi:hypothetical protein
VKRREDRFFERISVEADAEVDNREGSNSQLAYTGDSSAIPNPRIKLPLIVLSASF